MIVARHSGRDAGQIGRTADLHGFAARRVRDMDVPYASSVQGWQTRSKENFPFTPDCKIASR